MKPAVRKADRNEDTTRSPSPSCAAPVSSCPISAMPLPRPDASGENRPQRCPGFSLAACPDESSPRGARGDSSWPCHRTLPMNMCGWASGWPNASPELTSRSFWISSSGTRKSLRVRRCRSLSATIRMTTSSLPVRWPQRGRRGHRLPGHAASRARRPPAWNKPVPRPPAELAGAPARWRSITGGNWMRRSGRFARGRGRPGLQHPLRSRLQQQYPRRMGPGGRRMEPSGRTCPPRREHGSQRGARSPQRS